MNDPPPPAGAPLDYSLPPPAPPSTPPAAGRKGITPTIIETECVRNLLLKHTSLLSYVKVVVFNKVSTGTVEG